MQMVVHRHTVNPEMQKETNAGEIVQVADPRVLELC